MDGTAITSDADGKAIPAPAGRAIFAVAEESYNNTSGEDQLVRVRPASGTAA